jgi:hypothetical protein
LANPVLDSGVAVPPPDVRVWPAVAGRHVSWRCHEQAPQSYRARQGAPFQPETRRRDNGLTEPPKDLAEFEALLDKAKATGITPIIVANKIGLPGHVWNMLLGGVTQPLAPARGCT